MKWFSFRLNPTFELCFVFTLLFGSSLVIFRHGILIPPIADSIVFVMERNLSESDFGFFLKSLSYNRTRTIAPGDHYLFRPGMTGTLALIDVFLSYRLFWIGVISLFWHSLTAFSIYVLSKTRFSRKVSFVFSFFFLTHYSGIELILWHHISPYMVSLFMLGFGLYSISRYLEDKQNGWIYLGGISLFISMLFHELLSYALPCLVCLFFLNKVFLRFFKRNSLDELKGKSLQNVFIMMVIILGVYWGANCIDFYLRGPFLIFGSVEDVGKISIGKALKDLIELSGMFFLAFICPWAIKLVPSTQEGDFRAEWNLSAFPVELYWASAFVFLVIFFMIIRKQQSIIVYTLSLCMVALISGFTVMRTEQRGWDYFKHCPYYFYFFNFFMLIVLLFRWKPSRNIGRCLIAWCLLMTIVSTFKIHTRLKPLYRERREIAKITLELGNFMSKTQYCFRGAMSPHLNEKIDRVSLFGVSCERNKKIPAYLIEDSRSEIYLVELTENGRFQKLKHIKRELT